MATQAMTLQELTDRVSRLEDRISKLARELERSKASVPRRVGDGARAHSPIIRTVDKALLKKHFDAMCARLGITSAPIGIEELRAQMAEAGLGPNELSQGIIAMRDE